MLQLDTADPETALMYYNSLPPVHPDSKANEHDLETAKELCKFLFQMSPDYVGRRIATQRLYDAIRQGNIRQLGIEDQCSAVMMAVRSMMPKGASKAAIFTKLRTDISRPRWNTVIGRLLRDQRVIMRGDRKGAKYLATNRTD